MNQKIIIITLVVMALLVGGVWYYTQPAANETPEAKLVSEQAKDLDIKSFSLGGTVVKIDSESFQFKTGSVKDTPEGRKYVEEEKKVLIFPNMPIFMKDFNNKAMIQDLKPGSDITVYTRENPFESSEFTAYQILINY